MALRSLHPARFGQFLNVIGGRVADQQLDKDGYYGAIESTVISGGSLGGGYVAE
jgi:hypothetical protein